MCICEIEKGQKERERNRETEDDRGCRHKVRTKGERGEKMSSVHCW